MLFRSQYVSNNLTRGVSSSSPTRVIEDFFEAAFNSCTLTNTDTYIKRLFVMSYFSAEFNYRNGAWEKSSTTPTNTLRFNFPDKNGQSCVAEVVGSGTETEVHAAFSTTQNGVTKTTLLIIAIKLPQRIASRFPRKSM